MPQAMSFSIRVTWARVAHLGLNDLIVLLFGWQAITGVAIVNKLLSA
jgi:hypothetical protein